MAGGRIALGGAVAGIAAASLLLGGVLHDSSSSARPAANPPSRPAAESLESGFSAGDTTSLVARLQQTVRADPADGQALDLLGLAYQQRARETGDPTYYTKSEGVLRRALALDQRDLLVTSGLGSLALSRHRFGEALRLGRQAERLSPTTSRNYGVIGDALAELGRYGEAFRAFDTMAALRPGLAAYARVAHARDLLGRVDPAIGAMKLALSAADGQPEPTAWTHVQLGKLYWSRGQIARAGREDRAALAAFPGYAYALDALALVEYGRGRLDRAIALEQEAVNLIPLPQYVAQLGDLYRARGRARQAGDQYALIGAIQRLLAANGVKTDLEVALFQVDHGIRLTQALRLARLAQRERPSIDGDDVLAWALARSGRCGEALPYSKRALRLGTLDALKFFHRGMIERCLGHEATAETWFRRAVTLNPHFSVLWSPLAARLAAGTRTTR
jgi:tetratricopeptide (TPR) repeat protein